MNHSLPRYCGALALAAMLSVCGCEHGAPSPELGPAPTTLPVADAGADQIVSEGATVTLAGAGSDAEGAVTFAWRQLSGPAVVLSSTNVPSPSFVAPAAPIGAPTIVELRLSVTDTNGRVANDDVRVTARSTDYVIYQAFDIPTLTQEILAYDPETGARSTLAGPIPVTTLPPEAFALQIAPDRSRVAFVTDALFSALPDGTGLVRLADAPYLWGWSPDGSRIAFASFDASGGPVGPTGPFDLYTVRADGGSPVLIQDGVVAYGGFLAWRWAPDGSAITFLSRDASAGGATQVRAAAPDGSTRVELSNAQPGEDVRYWAWSPNAAWLAYADDTRVFAVRPDGTQRRAVLAPNGSGSLLFWSWSPTSAHLGALFNDGTGGEILAVRPDGTGLASIAALAGLRRPGGAGPTWLPDGLRVLFFTESAGARELFSSRLDGSAPARLGPAAPNSALGGLAAPDSSRVLLPVSPSLTTPATDLYASHPDGTALVRLSEPIPPGGAGPDPIGWSPDSSHVLFIAETETAGVKDLYAIRADGTQRVRLNESASARSVLPFVSWSPDGARVAFMQTQSTYFVEAFSVVRDGTGRALLTPQPMSVGRTEWSPDGSRIASLQSAEPGNSFDLVVMRPDGTDRVSLQDTAQGFVIDFVWAP